jgi:hypothetical protein
LEVVEFELRPFPSDFCDLFDVTEFESWFGSLDFFGELSIGAFRSLTFDFVDPSEAAKSEFCDLPLPRCFFGKLSTSPDPLSSIEFESRFPFSFCFFLESSFRSCPPFFFAFGGRFAWTDFDSRLRFRDLCSLTTPSSSASLCFDFAGRLACTDFESRSLRLLDFFDTNSSSSDAVSLNSVRGER